MPELEELSRRGRWLAISSVASSGAGHVGGSFSAMDLLFGLGRRYTSPRYKPGDLATIFDWNGLQQFGWVLQLTSSTGTIDVIPRLE